MEMTMKLKNDRYSPTELKLFNILQASKQNATGTQQAEAGAKNLNQLGQNLKLLVGRFTV